MIKMRVRGAVFRVFTRTIHYLGKHSLRKTGVLTDLLHSGVNEWIQVYKRHYPFRISDLDKTYELLRKELIADFHWLYGPTRLREVAGQLRQTVHSKISLDGITYLDLGCGTHNPLGMSALMYLNGVKRAFALDLYEPEGARAAVALYDLLVDCFSDSDSWSWPGTSRATFLDRLARFDLKALREGDLQTGIANVPLSLSTGDIENHPFSDQSFELISSHLVLEHVLNFRDAMERLLRVTAPGGLSVHLIDLSDHRYYTDPRRYHQWSFLAEAENWTDGRCNRLRAGEIRQVFEETGFEILEFRLTREDMPVSFHEQVKGRFRQMSEDELSTISVLAVLKKPE